MIGLVGGSGASRSKPGPPATEARFRCGRCGREHPGPRLSYRIPAPADFDAIPEADRTRRATLGADRCTIDDEACFVVADLYLSIRDSLPRVLTFTVWVSLSRADFERFSERSKRLDRELEPPDTGWLSNRLPGFPDTMNLEMKIHTRPLGQRPYVELEPTDHPLAVAQRDGITRDRVREFAGMAEHPEPEAEENAAEPR